MSKDIKLTKAGSDIMAEIAKYHSEWIKVCSTFVGRDDAEDIVQDMYIKIVELKTDLNVIKYENTINKYYIYKTLRNLCYNFLKKKKKKIDLDDDIIENTVAYIEANEQDDAHDKLFNIIDKLMEEWSSYDRNLFELYMYSGLSYRDLSHGTEKSPKMITKDRGLSEISVRQGTGISVNSIWTTINHCKQRIIDELGEDYEDYKNGNFELIITNRDER